MASNNGLKVVKPITCVWESLQEGAGRRSKLAILNIKVKSATVHVKIDLYPLMNGGWVFLRMRMYYYYYLK